MILRVRQYALSSSNSRFSRFLQRSILVRYFHQSRHRKQCLVFALTCRSAAGVGGGGDSALRRIALIAIHLGVRGRSKVKPRGTYSEMKSIQPVPSPPLMQIMSSPPKCRRSSALQDAVATSCNDAHLASLRPVPAVMSLCATDRTCRRHCRVIISDGRKRHFDVQASIDQSCLRQRAVCRPELSLNPCLRFLLCLATPSRQPGTVFIISRLIGGYID